MSETFKAVSLRLLHLSSSKALRFFMPFSWYNTPNRCMTSIRSTYAVNTGWFFPPKKGLQTEVWRFSVFLLFFSNTFQADISHTPFCETLAEKSGVTRYKKLETISPDQISCFISYSARERAEFNKSCNLIGSGSGRNFLIRTAAVGGIHRVDLFSLMN